MSIEFLNLAFKADIQKSSTKFVLVAMADYANEVGEAYPTVETITKKTSLNRKTIISALKELAELGFISDTGMTRGRTGQVRVWKLSLKEINKVVPDGSLNSPENGMLKASQKRNSTENGTVPFFPDNHPKNGTLKASQKRDTEPSVLLTINEPPVKEKTRTKKFTKPTVAEISDYCHSRKNQINPQQFFDYYESIGWMVGRAAMKDWQAAVRTWEQREGKANETHQQGNQLRGAAAQSAAFHEDLKRFARGVDSQTVQQDAGDLHPPVDKRISNY